MKIINATYVVRDFKSDFNISDTHTIITKERGIMKGKYVSTIVLYGIRLNEAEAQKIYADWKSRCENDEAANFVDNCSVACLLADKIDIDEHSRHYQPGHRHVFGIPYAWHDNQRLDNLTHAIINPKPEALAGFELVKNYLMNMGVERLQPEAILINQHI
jgi:hypothetical protein